MHQQRKISFFILALLLQNCAPKLSPNLTCKDFKFGQFEILNTEVNSKFIIERNDNFQIEKIFDLRINEKIQEDKYFFLDWNNECEYQLKIDTTKSRFDTFDLQINSLGGLNNRIIKINGKCAEVETKLDNQIIISKICKK